MVCLAAYDLRAGSDRSLHGLAHEFAQKSVRVVYPYYSRSAKTYET
jgi:hypothetical protein